MAVQTWEEIVSAAQLSADERKLLDNIVQKVPEFKDGRLRQADYSRKLTELQTQEKEYTEALAYNQKMKVWADEKVPIWESLVEQGVIDEESKPLWPEEKARLAAELEAAKKAAVGGEMDPAELDKRVKEIVVASGLSLNAEQYRNLYASEGKKLVEETINAKYTEFEKNFNEKTIPFTTGFATSMAIMANKFEKETGKEFTDEDQKAVFDLMSKEKDFNPRTAVEKYMEPTVREKKTAADIERLAEERANKIIAERGGLPGGGSEGHFPTGEARGSLQKMLEQSAKEGEGDVESLTMAAARTAAAELRSVGKF
jgi:23S rRNA maturation mini-RNase III